MCLTFVNRDDANGGYESHIIHILWQGNNDSICCLLDATENQHKPYKWQVVRLTDYSYCISMPIEHLLNWLTWTVRPIYILNFTPLFLLFSLPAPFHLFFTNSQIITQLTWAIPLPKLLKMAYKRLIDIFWIGIMDVEFHLNCSLKWSPCCSSDTLASRMTGYS